MYIKKIDILSLAKSLAVTSAFLGFVAGILWTILASKMQNKLIYGNPVYLFGLDIRLGYFAIIIIMVIFVICGYALGAIVGFLHNLSIEE